MSDWRNRIVGTDVVNPKTLVPNEKNFRRHPNRQVAALEGSLDEIGWIAPVTVNRLTGRMLDGHARAELALTRRHSDAVGDQPSKGGANPTRSLLISYGL